MTRDEFNRQLQQLREVLLRALAYYAVWKSLKLHDGDKVGWTREDQNALFARFNGFFTSVGLALLDSALLEFAKMFDNDSRTASLNMLLAAARRDPTLVPHTSATELREKSRALDRVTAASLMELRNERLAHLQASPPTVNSISTTDIDQLAESVMAAFNTLSVGSDNSSTLFGSWLSDSERHTNEVLCILIEEQKHRRQRHEEEMVQIGLEHLRRERIPKEFVRDEIRTLGLSEEQMERVEKQYEVDATEATLE